MVSVSADRSFNLTPGHETNKPSVNNNIIALGPGNEIFEGSPIVFICTTFAIMLYGRIADDMYHSGKLGG